MSESKQRSVFVTVVAWIFIVLSGFTTMISLLQNIMLFSVFREPAFHSAMTSAPPGMSGPQLFMLNHMVWLFVGFLLVSVMTLASAIGLLRRRNWARWCFVGLMVLGIAWNLCGLVFQLVVMGSMSSAFDGGAPSGAPNMHLFFVAMVAMSAIMAIGFSILFGWIAKRLLSPDIAAEFQG